MTEGARGVVCGVLVLYFLVNNTACIYSQFVRLKGVRCASGTRIGRRVAPVGAHMPKFVGGVYFRRCRRMQGNSALIVVRSTRFHLHMTRTRTSLTGTATKQRTAAVNVTAARGGLDMDSTDVRRMHMRVRGTGHRLGHFRGLLRRSTIAGRRCSGIRATCRATGTHCRRMSHTGRSASLIGDRRARHLKRGRTNIHLTRITLRLTHLGLSCAVVVTPYSNAAKGGRVLRNRLIRPKRAVISVMSDDSL